MLLAVAVTLGLLVLVVRPARGSVTLPPGWRILPLGPRLLAQALDLLPGALVALLLADASLRDLLRAPMFTIDLEACTGYLVMAGVTMVHSTASEGLAGRTLGKALVGARVLGRDGLRPGPGRLLLRNLGKLIAFVAPPLVLLCLFSHNLQGVPDQLGRTVVASEVPEDEQAAGDR
jgi:uncharacterized RDD family membrane protein YckC